MAKNNIKMKKVNTSKKTSTVEEMDIKGFTIVICAIALVVIIAYALTLLAKNVGLFDEHYIKPEVGSATINYETIAAGTIFNRLESDYYVMIADFESDDSAYLSSLGSLYGQKTDKIPMYVINLKDEMNKSIISDSSNPSAQTVTELKVNGHTLIRMSNGRNIKYIEGDENIKLELGI